MSPSPFPAFPSLSPHFTLRAHDRCRWRSEAALGRASHRNPLAMLLALAAWALLSACGPSTSPLTLELRTADTHTPIAGAAIDADSLALGSSLQVSDIVDDLMGRRAAFSDRGMTDARGVARLEHVPDRALRITVITPGIDPAFALVDQPLTPKPTPWLPTAGSPSHPSSIEFRLTAPQGLTSLKQSSSPASR